MSTRSFNAPTLRTLLALVFGGFSALLAVLLCVGGGELLKLRLQQQAANALNVVAHNAAVLLQQDLAQQIRRAQVMAQSQELWEQGLDSRGVGLLLNRMQHINPHNVWIGVADTQGTVRNASGNLLQGANVSQRPWFQEALHGPSISEVHTAKLLASLLPASTSGEPLRLVDFSAPIHSPQGQLLGVIGIHGSWDWVREVVEKLLQGTAKLSQQSIFIFDSQGEMIYAPDGVLTPFTRIGQTLPAGLNDSAKPSTLVRWKDADHDFLSAAVRLPAPTDEHDPGWWVVARQPVQAAYADANRMLAMAIGVALVAGLLAILVAWRLAKYVSDDLKTLAHATQTLQDTPGTPIPVLHSHREVQQLSQSLHRMTQQLLHANERMHEQVQQRTEQLQAANAELERQASTDPLTRLLNRRGFHFQADLTFALAQRSQLPLSVVTLDIDFFKRINDTYGHDVGDAVLVQLARLLQQHTRKTDICARFGGEEFVVVLPDTDRAAALHWVQMLLQRIAETPLPPVGHITVSAGVSNLLPGVLTDSLPGMLKRSDAALYQAKQTGRNRACMAD